MSTKIYNAFHYDGNINELIEDLKKFRDKVIVYRIEQFIESFKILMNRDDLQVSWFGVQDSFIRMIQGIDREGDLPPSCIVYFHKKKIYVQLFGLDRKEIGMFCEISDKFSEFWYADNTDLDAELKKRGKIWKEIFEKSGIPEEVGLSFEFFPKRLVVHNLIEINNSSYNK